MNSRSAIEVRRPPWTAATPAWSSAGGGPSHLAANVCQTRLPRAGVSQPSCRLPVAASFFLRPRSRIRLTRIGALQPSCRLPAAASSFLHPRAKFAPGSRLRGPSILSAGATKSGASRGPAASRPSRSRRSLLSLEPGWRSIFVRRDHSNTGESTRCWSATPRSLSDHDRRLREFPQVPGRRAEFNRVVDPRKMVKPYVATDGAAALAEV